MSDHVSPVSMYVTIFSALMILTGVTVAAAFLNLGPFNFAVAMLIAGFKASLVVWYFMHVKYSPRLTWVVVVGSIFWLAILLAFTLSDYLTRGWMTFG